MPHISSPTGDRLRRLRKQFDWFGVDAVLVPRADAHQGEYCAPHDDRLRYLTGFTGSAGMALILRDRAVLFVDGRYQIQARRQVDPEQVELAHLIETPVAKWMAEAGLRGLRVAINTMLIGSAPFAELAESMARIDGSLVGLEADPVDAIWVDQPSPPLGAISIVSREIAGEDADSKRKRVGAALAAAGADLLLEALPDNIGWLLNVRGSDVAYTTGPHAFALVDATGALEWIVDSRKLPRGADGMELADVSFASPSSLKQRIRARSAGQRVLIDPQQAPAAFGDLVRAAGGTVVSAPSPATLLKATKNPVELQGFRDCHVADGVAVANFMAWLETTGPVRSAEGRPITELEAEERVLGFRQLSAAFTGPSFHAISAFGANAAMSHYVATPESNAGIDASNLYLLDSGGHYSTGTTDITRTMALGSVGDTVRAAYTAVLKGFLATLMLRFPAGTYGHQIDAFARKPLWDLGLDFDHGTGHGVGHIGAIHEGPHRITRHANPFPIVAGTVLTVEPGQYREGAYGIRIENQVEAVEVAPGFLQLRSLTLCPVPLRLADLAALDAAECAFIDAYHASVRQALEDKVLPETHEWLIAATKPIAEQLPV